MLNECSTVVSFDEVYTIQLVESTYHPFVYRLEIVYKRWKNGEKLTEKNSKKETTGPKQWDVWVSYFYK